LEEGYRESKESWLEVLRHLRDRGMPAPVHAVGDGALGFWTAVAEVWSHTKYQRWFHKMGNILFHASDQVTKLREASAVDARYGGNSVARFNLTGEFRPKSL
jgi:transposase-like protein